MTQHALRRNRRRDHSHAAGVCREHPQDVVFSAIVDGYDMVTRAILKTTAALAVPHRLRPLKRLAASHLLSEVHPLKAGPLESLRPKIRDVERSRRIVCDCPIRWSEITDSTGEPPRIHAGDSDQAVRFKPSLEGLGGAVIRRRSNRGAQHKPAGDRRRGFDVLRIGSDVANVWEGEGNDLASI